MISRLIAIIRPSRFPLSEGNYFVVLLLLVRQLFITLNNIILQSCKKITILVVFVIHSKQLLLLTAFKENLNIHKQLKFKNGHLNRKKIVIRF